MSAERFEASAERAHAQEPRLFGVPVPARAFGFAPGWSRCAASVDDHRGTDDEACRASVRALSAIEWRRGAGAPSGNAMHRYAKTIQQEVAAA